MADPRALPRDSFDATKKYRRLVFFGDTACMPWEMNEVQQIREHMLKLALDRVFKNGAIIGELGGTIESPTVGVHTGDDSLASGGTFLGIETIVYLVKITVGGAPGTAKFDFTTTGADTSQGPVTVAAFDTPYALGSYGATITFTDGGDGVLTALDSWYVGCTYLRRTPTVSGNDITMAPAMAYIDGAIEIADGEALTYAAASTGKSYVYLEALTQRITYDDDATLVNEETLQPVAQRLKLVLAFKSEDTSANPLPTGCIKRAVVPVYEWDRATDIVTRVHERPVRFDLNDLDGIILSDRVQRWDMQEELKGILAERTDEESGPYIVGPHDLESWIAADQNNEAEVGSAAADSGNSGDDVATASGTYEGTEDQTYTVEMTTGGAVGTAKITVTSTGSDSSGPTTVVAFGTAVAVGTLGAEITFVDGGDGVLVAGDKWTIECSHKTMAVITGAGVAYVSGLRYEKLVTEMKRVSAATTTASVDDEGHTFAFGSNVVQMNKSVGDDDFPIKEYDGVTAQAYARKNITRGMAGGGSDLLPLTPVGQVLSVSNGTPPSLTGTATVFTFTGTPEENDFVIQASPWAGGSLGAAQTILFTPGTWLIAQILEALNCGTGPAYSSGSANENLYYSDDGSGHIVVETFGGSTSQALQTGTGGANTILGFSDSDPGTGATGTQYALTTDYLVTGNYIDWSPGGAEPTGGSSFQTVFSHSKALTQDTHFKQGGDLTGTTYWCVSVTRGSAESYPSNIVSIAADIAKLTWTAAAYAEEYRVYRGSTTGYGNLKLVAVLPSTALTFMDTGYITAGSDSPNESGIKLMTPLGVEKIVEGALNFDIGGMVSDYGSGNVEINRPLAGSQVIADYAYYQPRITRRCILHTGEIVDVDGLPADDPKEPDAPAFSLPLARILCPANTTNAVVYNYGFRTTPMIEIRSIVKRLEDLQYNDIQSDLMDQIHNEEASVLRGAYAEAFTTALRGDVGFPDFDIAMDPVERCMKLPFAFTQKLMSSWSGTGYREMQDMLMIDYTEELAQSQLIWSSEWNVNPYATFYPDAVPSAWIILSPARDYWVDTRHDVVDGIPPELIEQYKQKMIELGGDGSHFHEYVNEEENWILEHQHVGLQEAVTVMDPLTGQPKEELRSRIESMKQERVAFARSIPIEVYGMYFGAGEEVTLYFNDYELSVSPTAPWTGSGGKVTADAFGNFRCTFDIPCSPTVDRLIKSGKHVVKATSETKETNATFVSEGELNVLTERKWKVRTKIDPVAQTFSFAEDGFLTKIDIPMATKDAALPLQFMLREVMSGLPSDYVRMVEVRPSANVNVGDTLHNYWVPEDLIFMPKDESKAMSLLTASPEGYKVYVAEGGEKDSTGDFIATQPYERGVFMDSSNMETWTPHQAVDMLFRAYRAVFGTTAVINFDPVYWTGYSEITGTMLMAEQVTPEGTGIIWEYSILSASVWQDWEQMSPMKAIDFAGITAEALKVRATLTSTNDRVSPMIKKRTVSLVMTQNRMAGVYLTNTTELVQSVDTVKVLLDEYNPSGTGIAGYGQVTGIEPQNFVIVTGTNDKLLVSTEGVTDQTVTLPSGTLTATQVVAQINSDVTESIATVVNGKVLLKSLTLGGSGFVELKSVSNDAYETLGLRVGKFMGYSGGHEVLLSADGGLTWMTHALLESAAGDDGYTRNSYTFGGESEFDIDSVKLRIANETTARYVTPKAKNLGIAMS